MFRYCYGYNYQDFEIATEKWRLPITDLYGNNAEISLYVTDGEVLSLLKNDILPKSIQLSSDNFRIVPDGAIKLQSKVA